MTMRGLLVAVMLAAAVPALAQEKCANCGARGVGPRVHGQDRLDAARRHGERRREPERGRRRACTQYNFSTGNVVLLGAARGAGDGKRPNSYERPRWEIAVRMDDGSRRTVTNDYEPAIQAGDRVRV